MVFIRHIGIDYSGAQTPTASLKRLRIYLAEGDASPGEVPPPPSLKKYWTRRGKTGHSRQLVRHVLRSVHGDVFRTRQSSLDAYLTRLDAQWTDGCRNSAERRLRSEGFGGSLRVVGEWATRRRRAEKASDLQLQKVPSARTPVGQRRVDRLN